MKTVNQVAILLALDRQMEKQGSWCGETHLQKAMFFLQALADVPAAFDFVLYKHGPFSFDLRNELTGLRADGLMKLHPQPAPYGPSILTTETGDHYVDNRRSNLGKYEESIRFVAEQLADKGVSELERLSTALYVMLKHHDISSAEKAERIAELKPHIDLTEAREAIEQVKVMQKKWESDQS